MLYKACSVKKMKISLKKEVAADIDSSKLAFKPNCLPCLTASRGSTGGFWLAARRRKTSLSEMFRAQGIRQDGVKQCISDTAMGKAIGNGMSQNVLERLFVRLLPAAGLAKKEELHDRYYC